MPLADGTVDYNYDDRSQLTGADYTGANLPADESYTYDANGNRELADGAAYQTDPNNRLADDGMYTYEYDGEGNLSKRTTISDGSYIDYTWDHRNRLTQIGERTSVGGTVKDFHYTYDAFDRRIAKAIVEPGQPTDNFVFVYDGEHIAMALRYDDVGQEYELANRYLHGPSVDMILADEQVTDASQEGNVLWPLTDNLGSVRDIADYDAASDVTTIANHLVYDSFGNIASETNAAIDHIFGYTGRERDQESDLHYNRARYYDPRTARFVSEDPIGFSGGDPNLHRYVGNNATGAADPSGLITIPVGGSTAGSSGNQPRSSDSSGIEDIHYSNQDWAPGGWWNPLNWGKWIYAENGQRVGNGIGAAMTLDLNSYRERQSLLINRASHGELDDVQAFGNLAGEEMQGALVKSGQIVSGVFAAGELAADTVGIAASGIPRSGAGAAAKIPARTAPNNSGWRAAANAADELADAPFAPGSVGAAKAWTSVRSRLKAAQLPMSGKIRFVPPKNYNPASPLTRGPGDGYIDRFGNEWVRGPSRTAGEPFEWDVQLSNRGREMLGWLSREGNHVNVSLGGRVTH